MYPHPELVRRDVHRRLYALREDAALHQLPSLRRRLALRLQALAQEPKPQLTSHQLA